MYSLVPLIRSRTGSGVAATGHLARQPDQLERMVRSKWLLWRNLPRRRRHGLPAPLHVTLTSRRPHFRTLATTIKSLLMQRCVPDRVILLLAEADAPSLPREIAGLTRFGLEVRTGADLELSGEIVRRTQASPAAFLATADDGCCYGPGWLEQLAQGWTPYSREVICHRAHRIRLDPRGLPLPHGCWNLELRLESAHPLNIIAGSGGVLYPPGCFGGDGPDPTVCQELGPGAQEVWLWWLLRRNGYWVRKVGGPSCSVRWPESQLASACRDDDFEHGADDAVRRMTARFGFPGPRRTAYAAC